MEPIIKHQKMSKADAKAKAIELIKSSWNFNAEKR